jgi:hypothetical protein
LLRMRLFRLSAYPLLTCRVTSAVLGAGWDGSVGIVTNSGSARPGFDSRQAYKFFLILAASIRAPRTHPAFYTMGKGEEEAISSGSGIYYLPPSSAEANNAAIPPPPPPPIFIAWCLIV